MDTLRKLYTVVAENIRKAREKQPRQETLPPKLQVNDLVLVKDPESAVFEPRYMPNYRITAIFGRNRIEVQDERGNKSLRCAAHVKACHPVDKVVDQLPPQTVYEQYGRASKLLIHPKDVPQIPLQLFNEQQQPEEIQKLTTETPILVDTTDESGSQKETSESGEPEGIDVFAMDWAEDTPIAIDTYDESRSRCLDVMIETAKLKTQQELLTRRRDYNTIDTCDESKNRGLKVITKTVQIENPEEPSKRMRGVNVVDDSDESRNRLTKKKPQYNTAPNNAGSVALRGSKDNCINISDASRTRCHRPVLSSMCDSTQGGNFCINLNDTTGRISEVTQPSKSVCDCDDESRCRSNRCNRCSLSTNQHTPQLAAPAFLDGCIVPTVVNTIGIDKRGVTNKQGSTKQDSLLMGNKWLSSTFSKLTSSVLGRSGQGNADNINETSDHKIDFNFFL